MNTVSTLRPSGDVGLQLIRASRTTVPGKELSLKEILQFGSPLASGIREEVRDWRARNIMNLWRGVRRVMAARTMGLPTMYGALSLAVIRKNGECLDLGLASLRVVTDAGVAYIVDAFQNSVELENMKYHGFGTGTTNEAVGDTALVTELTTQYATDNTRPTGTLTEGATGNIFRTIATLSPDASAAITEHGIFSQAANSGGTLLDRSKFAAVNLVSGDSLQATYDLTLSSGG
jgi:hypothetical protein